MRDYLLYGLLVVALAACRAPLSGPEVAAERIAIDADVAATAEDSPAVQKMAATIAPYKAQLDEQMGRVLAEVAAPLTKGSPESNLGNWTADLTYAAARRLFPDRRIDFAILNSGGLRVGEINAGPLLVSELYELMPFDNELVLLELTGKELTEFLAHVANSGGWPVSEQLSVQPGRGKMTMTVNGRPIAADQPYLVALPDYVAGGGSGSSMLVGKTPVKSGRLLRDLWIEEVATAEGPIRVTAEGRRFRLE